MGPLGIITKSREMNLDLIAVCDHNSAENAGAVMRAGAEKGLSVLPGMEVCSKEEVHVVAIFDELSQAIDMQEYIYGHLPGQNSPELFGYQVIADENNEVRGENNKLLIGATDLGLHEIVNHISLLGGLSFASHIDRQSFSVISQLGFIPPDIGLDGVEVSSFAKPVYDDKKFPGADKFPFITSSDAHFLDDIGKVRTIFMVYEPTISEIRMALKGSHGRYVEA
jgi:PHP family Zn ribbon phosphoesterase